MSNLEVPLMSKRKQSIYTDEFKEEALKLVSNSSESTAQIAKNLGINASTLYTWVHNDSKPQENKKVTQKDPVDDEIKHLKKQVLRLTQERDILKKAAAYFAQEIV